MKANISTTFLEKMGLQTSVLDKTINMTTACAKNGGQQTTQTSTRVDATRN
jgi:hypothetical protein